MNTLIESINKIIEIKQDLNEVLRDNGIEGGEVFTDYPDKFRQLFRVITAAADATTTGYTNDTEYVITDIPAPSLRQYQNVVYVTNNYPDATIYYSVYTDSGEHDIAVTRLVKGNSIVVSEPSTVIVYAQYRAEKSAEVSIYVPWSMEVVPNPPTIVRDGTTVTMTCDDGDEIYYYTSSLDGYTLYTGPVTVARWQDIYAYAQNYRGRSDTVLDPAPEQPDVPEIPTLSCSQNVVTMSCATAQATIYYKKSTDRFFVEYTTPFAITESGYYIVKSSLNDVWSDESQPIWVEYIEVPSAPVITTADNVVTITCENSDIIFYKIGNGEYQIYMGPIVLTETVTITAYGENQGMEGPTATATCTYVGPITVSDPVFHQTINVISITCSTTGADIWYRINGEGNWILYELPIDITEDTSFEAYATVGTSVSDTVTYDAEYIDAEADAPAAPVGSCTNNVVTITCSTPNADIYYRDINDGYWTLYEGPFQITETHTYVIYSTKYGLVTYGTTFTATYDSGGSNVHKLSNPVITYNPSAQQVTITHVNTQASIYYSFNNSDWTQYTGPVSITEDGFIYAYAKMTGWDNSDVVSKYCSLGGEEPIVQTVATPVINWNDPIVTITCATSGATIYYSYDNSTWTAYAGNIILNTSKTVYAKATKSGMNPSSITYRYCETGESSDSYANEYFSVKLNQSGTGLYLYIDTSTTKSSSAVYYRYGGSSNWQSMNYWNVDDGSMTPFKYWTVLENAPAGTIIQFKRTLSSYNGRAYADKHNTAVTWKDLSGKPSDTPLFMCLRIVNTRWSWDDAIQYEVFGNILSMQLGDDFASWNENTLADYWGAIFDSKHMFGTGLYDASNLYLPRVLSYGCFYNMFCGCTNLISGPKLPVSSTLPGACYARMFYGCTSLVNAPKLPAQIIDSDCFVYDSSGQYYTGSYASMFYGCSSLSLVKVNMVSAIYYYGTHEPYSIEYDNGGALFERACLAMLTGVAASGTFVKNSSATWNNAVVIPSGWTVQTA